jgi:diguanylate cyclase (GGDEF)-like protein
MSGERPSEQKAPLPAAEAEARFWTHRGKFPSGMEQAFQSEMERMRATRMRKTGLIALLLYGAFAISDRAMVPDVYLQAWVIRFLLVMPLMLLLTLCVNKVRQPALRELLLSSSVVIVGASLLLITALSHHPNALHYRTGITLVVLFGNIVLGLRLRDAVITSALITLLYALSLMPLHAASPDVRFNDWLFYLSSVVISLIANFRMDQDQRRAYLARTREHQRNTELSDAVELLARLSAEDALTQIANRREFERRLNLEWSRAKRDARSLALILIDVDCFKNYNDYYGHPAGDACLRRIAAVLRTIPRRAPDLVARFGGEEFVVLLPGTSVADAAQMAQRMQRAVVDLLMPHAASSVAPGVTASFGVAGLVPARDNQPLDLVTAADAALYRAKEGGRNRVVTHEPPPA